ncbi:MAG: ATP-binding protein, partial [Chloroflexota bacterium]
CVFVNLQLDNRLLDKHFFDLYLLPLNELTRLYRESRDQLAYHQLELEQLVEKRTAQFEVEKNKAEEASHAKSTFLASMSHEFRTPLNAIIGYSEMVEDELNEVKFDPEVTQDVSKVVVAARNLLKLTNEILDLSKIEAQEVSFNIQKCSVNTIVEQVSHLMAPLFEESGNSYELDLIDPNLYIWGDEPKVRQILVNLLNNANKFTKQGRIALVVEPIDENVQFSVIDSGRGIAPEFVPQLFDPYQQQQDQDDQIEGTGLGLTISKRFVVMMNGKIEVESELGVGSSFYVCLPRVRHLLQQETAKTNLASTSSSRTNLRFKK